ncbi:uncharacterized protein LOC126896880 isoform X2 [Daktulosphaira vitifoliae]|uniref:uncharacterized protein LOC126896880 isoform X2 n=1 Tax=Daktulosphaira vitifoliae TaxID=58002 RepID=UPI0021AA405C|nr:uncharacterized protein LOC126896880 isoform X2 [Daktulosphaira vitifoliae]
MPRLIAGGYPKTFIVFSNCKSGIAVPYKCFLIDKNLKTQFKRAKSPLYYNPVDANWKRAKCSSLGLTYKEPIWKHELTSYMIPVESFHTEFALPIVLSELICGDRNLKNHFARNIVKNLTSNEDIEKLFENKDLFEEYIANSMIIKRPDIPVDVNEEIKCPVCYEKKYRTYYFNGCTHRVCEICADKLIIKMNYNCPFCRRFYPESNENNEVVISIWDTVEILAAAYYLNVCIYVYEFPENIWILYRNISTRFDSKNEKCIYLYKTEIHWGVVTNLTSP